VNHNIRPFGVNALNGEFLLRFDYYFSSFFFRGRNGRKVMKPAMATE
jgi:hypothetical protein